MYWYKKVLSQYANFNGRARRKEYWMFALFYFVFGLVAMILDSLLGTTMGEFGSGIIYLIFVTVHLIPYLAVSIRRLHDVGKSGWMILIGLIPIIGAIWLLVLFVSNGDEGENKYGPDPKSIAA